MFNLNSFKPASFSIQSFKMAEEADSGRSGYWKLFFYNMQEEELKKHEQKQREEAPQSASQRPKKSRSKPAVKATPSVEQRIVPEPPSRPVKRVVVADPPELPSITPYLAVISAELRLMYQTSQPLLVRLIDQERIKAANDEDEEDVVLLLLAA